MNNKQLNEARGGYLYHGTTLPRAAKAIADDVLPARASTHSPLVANPKYQNKTISLSRSLYKAKNFAHSADRDIPGVILVIDQAKLQQLVGRRLQAYDDTNTEWFRDQMKRHGNPFGNDPRSGRSVGQTESEEVVFGDIQRINQAIVKIIVLISSYDEAEQMARFNKSSLVGDPRVVLYDQWKMVKYDPNSNGKDDLTSYYKKPRSEFAIRRSLDAPTNESAKPKQTFLEFIEMHKS